MKCLDKLLELGFGNPVAPMPRDGAIAQPMELHIAARREVDAEDRVENIPPGPSLYERTMSSR